MNILEAVQALKKGHRVRRRLGGEEIAYLGGRVRLVLPDGRKGNELLMIQTWLEAEYVIVPIEETFDDT